VLYGLASGAREKSLLPVFKNLFTLLGMQPAEISELKREIEDCDAAIRNAELALSSYLASHPNSHAVHQTSRGPVVRLNAMEADLVLSGLERIRDEAKERFGRALAAYADAQKQEVSYVAGIQQC
jgi:hypothetical protein